MRIRETISLLIWMILTLWLLLAEYLAFIEYRKHARRENPYWNLSFCEWLDEDEEVEAEQAIRRLKALGYM